jgi:type VI secretion system secreted protein VgrG
VRFQGTDGISSPYLFDIVVTAKDADIDAESLIKKKATIFLQRQEEYYPYSGIITSFRYSETTVDYSSYRIVIHPALWLLSLTNQTRVFQKMTVPDIIKKILDDADLAITYSMDVQTYPQREYVVQYQESDLNFIQRLMETSGIWYFFQEAPIDLDAAKGYSGPEKLIITDKPAGFKEVPTKSTIKFRSRSGMVNQIDEKDTESVHYLELDRQLIAKEVIVKNYNYRTPEVDLESTKQIQNGDVGKVYEYGGTYKNSDEAQKSALVISNRNAMRKAILSGDSNSSGFRAGARFTLEEHSRESLNEKYVLMKIVHEGTHPDFHAAKNEKTYGNKFTCITSSQATHFAPEITAQAPKITGVMTGLIEGQGSQYAALDETGRYKIRMPFDRSDTPNYNASKYMRLAQPYSGANYGLHFPSHEGAEMIVGHIDGDPDKPLGLGTVPNADTVSPVKSTNREKSVLRTAGGHEMIMDDTKKSEMYSFHSPKDMSFTVDNDESESVGANKSKTVTKDETNTIKGNRSTTVNGTFTETVKKDVTIKVTEGNQTWRVEAGSLTAYVNNSVSETYDADQKTTVKGPIAIESTSDEITITASTNITLKCGLSSMKLSKDGTITIEGAKVTAKATTGLVHIDGVEVQVSAKGTLKSEAANIESAAKVSHNISAMMVAADGKTINIVKGGMVQLNP